MKTIEEVRREASFQYRKSPEGNLWYWLTIAGMVAWIVLLVAVGLAMLAAYEYDGDYQFTEESSPIVVVGAPLPSKLVVDGVDIRPDLEMATPGPRVPRGLVAGEAIIVALALIGLVVMPDYIDRRKRRRYIDEAIEEWAKHYQDQESGSREENRDA